MTDAATTRQKLRDATAKLAARGRDGNANAAETSTGQTVLKGGVQGLSDVRAKPQAAGGRAVGESGVQVQPDVRAKPQAAMPGGTGGGAMPVRRRPLSLKQQAEALRQVRAQAEQRIKLGAELLKAAEKHAGQARSYVEQMCAAQADEREQLERDVQSSLHEYDQWIARIDSDLTQRMDSVEEKLEAMHEQWCSAEQRIGRMIRRAETLFDQSRLLLERTATQLDQLTTNRRAGTVPSDQLRARSSSRSRRSADARRPTEARSPSSPTDLPASSNDASESKQPDEPHAVAAEPPVAISIPAPPAESIDPTDAPVATRLYSQLMGKLQKNARREDEVGD